MIPDINLMPPIERGDTSSKFVFILIGVFALLTVGVFTWLFFSVKNDLNTATAERDSLTVTRDELQAELTSYGMLNQGSLVEYVDFVERVSYPVTPILDETRTLLPENTYLRSYVFSEIGVEVGVDFETLNSISRYVSSLENSPYFDDIQVGAIQNFEINPSEEEKNDEPQFNEVPRYTVEISLIINHAHVASGGGQ